MFITLRKIVLLLFIFVLLRDFVVALKRKFPTCRSRDTCIRLTNCAPYMNLIRSLKKPLTRDAVLFLRKQECGFDGMYPMVCCFPSNTRRTQSNRFNSYDDKVWSTKPPTYYVSSIHDMYGNPEEDAEQNRAPKKPDLTPSDLSDYRSFKVQDSKILPAPDQIFEVPEEDLIGETSSPKSTTEKVKTTTRLFRRKVNSMLNNGDYDYINKGTTAPVGQFSQSEEARSKKAKEMKKKMEAINNAFMYSPLDFFVRRMDDKKN